MKNFKRKVDSRTWGVLGKQETFYAPTQFLGEKVPLNASPLDSWDYKKSKYRRIDLVPRTMENDGQQAGVVPQGTPVTPSPTPTNTQTPSVTPTNTNTPTPSVTATQTGTPTQTPTNTPTPSITPSASPAPSGTTEANTYLSAVVAAGGTVTSPMSAATVTLFTSLVSNGLYDKLSTFYPMIGGTQDSCKFNGKNPLNTDVAFRLTYAGGVSSNTNGLVFNGTNAVVDTYWVPNTNLTDTNGHISAYIKTRTGNGIWAGSNPTPPTTRFYLGYVGSNVNVNSINSGTEFPYPGTSPEGFTVITRTGTTTVELFNDGVLNNYTNTASSKSTLKCFIGARNNNGIAEDYSNITTNWISFGQKLNQTESVALTNIITTFQTALGRT